MNEITPAALSRMAGVSRARISTIMKADPPRLTIIEDDGKRKIDLDGHLTAKFLKGRSPKPDTTTPAKPKTGRPPTTSPEPPNPYQGDGKPPTGNNLSGLSGSDHEDENLKDIKLEEQIEKLRIENSQNRGKLIEKKLVTACFDRLAAIDENQFKSLAVRVGPKIEESLAESYDGKTTEILELLGRINDPDLKTDIQKIMNSGASARVRKITEIIEEDTGSVLKNIQYEFGKFLERCENG